MTDDKNKPADKKVVSIRPGIPLPEELAASVELEQTPEEVLLECLEAIRSGEMKATQIAVVALDREVGGDGYNLHLGNSPMRASELVCLFEAAKITMMEEIL